MVRVAPTLALALALAVGCGAEPAPPQVPARRASPDVLLVTIDTLRADRVGCYGDPLARTPSLDGLAEKSALFREALTVAPLTLPAHATLLTGCHPATHGLRDNGGFRLDPAVPTLAERLQEAGYRTGAFVSAYVLDAAWGLDRGFQHYRSPFKPQDVARFQAFGELELPGADTVNAALAFLREAGPEPAFCWVHLYDPHTPWAAHPGWTGDPYRGEVAFADALLGRLLDAVDPGALLVVVADHGEGLWDHGEREHGLLVHRSTARVPLLIRPPGGLAGAVQAPPPRPGTSADPARPAGLDADLVLDPVPDAPRAVRVVEPAVSTVDLAATIADYAGIAPVGEGSSLRPAVEGQPFERPPVYTETFFPRFHYGWSELVAVEDAGERLRLGPRAEVFDLTRDPAERSPRPAGEHRLLATARERLGSAVPTPGPVPVEVAEQLAALGYSAAVAPPTVPREVLPDPGEQTEILARLQRLESEPDVERAATGLRALVAEQPGLADARISLALTLRAAGKAREALGALRDLLVQQPHQTIALADAAYLCRELHEREEGLGYAQRLQAINPRDPRGYRLELALWVDAERPAEVVRVAEAALVLLPEDPQILYLYGLALLFSERPAEAVSALERARAGGSTADDIQLYLGTALDRAGELEAALEAYRAYSGGHPDDLRGDAAAASMLYQAGDCGRALPLLANLRRRGHAEQPRVREAWEACGRR